MKTRSDNQEEIRRQFRTRAMYQKLVASNSSELSDLIEDMDAGMAKKLLHRFVLVAQALEGSSEPSQGAADKPECQDMSASSSSPQSRPDTAKPMTWSDGVKCGWAGKELTGRLKSIESMQAEIDQAQISDKVRLICEKEGYCLINWAMAQKLLKASRPGSVRILRIDIAKKIITQQWEHGEDDDLIAVRISDMTPNIGWPG